MSRAVIYIALLQTLLVVSGFMALGTVLKIAGYPDSTVLDWRPLAVLLREHGAWLLLMPILWVFFAFAAGRLDHPFFSRRLVFFSGVGIAGIIAALFFYATVFPYTRPFFLPLH
jgi:hypothetical protein